MSNPYKVGQPGYEAWERMMLLRVGPLLTDREREDVIDLCFESFRDTDETRALNRLCNDRWEKIQNLSNKLQEAATGLRSLGATFPALRSEPPYKFLAGVLGIDKGYLAGVMGGVVHARPLPKEDQS